MNDKVEKDDRRDRYQRRRGRAQGGLQDDAQQPRRRTNPYKREQVDYDHYLQEEELEDEWFEHNM